MDELEEPGGTDARARSRSMAPNEMPLPPWTASPAGLSSASSASSSNRIGGSATRPGAGAAALACRRRGADRGHAQAIAQLEPRVRPDAALVDPDLAAPQDPVDVALGHAFEDLDEVIVDALARAVVADCKPVHSILA